MQTAIAVWLAVSCPAGAQGPPSIEITLRGSEFTLVSGAKHIRIPLAQDQSPAPRRSLERVVFRKDDAYAVWDSRGLTVRRGPWKHDTRLHEVAVTPKLFSSDEIAMNHGYFALGLRIPLATELAGAVRIGDFVYFLLRWVDFALEPWLEALVRVGLSDPKPKPELMGRFEGLAVEDAPAPGSLVPIAKRPSVVTSKTDGGWGRATFDPVEGVFTWKPLGERLGKLVYLTSTTGCAIEKTAYGSRLLGSFDLVRAEKQVLMESRSDIRLLDGRKPWLATTYEEHGIWLHNLQTGAKHRIPEDAALRRTAFGLLYWTPAHGPKLAELLDFDRFARLASWQDPNKPP